MLLELLYAGVGMMFAYQMTNKIVVMNMIPTKVLTKIGTFYLLFVIVARIYIRGNLLVWWSLLFVPIFVSWGLLLFLRRWRESGFQQEFPDMLTLLIMKMKAGRSFRAALDEWAAEVGPRRRRKMCEIRDLVVFSQQDRLPKTSRFVAHVIHEFRIADQNPHMALTRLQNWRTRLNAEKNFRRKSGQVLQQIRAQSFLMTGLYFAVLFFVWHTFGWAHLRTWVVPSCSLFVLGLVWIWLGGRRIKWKT